MAQSNRKFYRDNGAAAYDVYAWNDQAARQYDDNRAYERTLPTELPDEQVREQPYRRVKAKTAVAPFTLAGMLTVACLMILVIFGYVQLFEASSNVSRLETQLANLKEQQLMLQSKYDAKIDLTAAEEYAAEIGLTKCQPEQIVYVSFSGTDQAEIYTQQTYERFRRNSGRHAAEYPRPYRIFAPRSSISLDRTSQLEIRPHRGGLCGPLLF